MGDRAEVLVPSSSSKAATTCACEPLSSEVNQSVMSSMLTFRAVVRYYLEGLKGCAESCRKASMIPIFAATSVVGGLLSGPMWRRIVSRRRLTPFITPLQAVQARHVAQFDRPAEMRGSIGGIANETVPEQAGTYDVVFVGDGPGECRAVHHRGHRPDRDPRRGRAPGRRVLVLRLYAQQGAPRAH